MASTQFTTPNGGRWVQGSIWKGQTKDMDGNPLVWKTGADAGKPRQSYFFSVAIPKAGEQHWDQTPWGAIIRNAGITGFPAALQRPNFAWKVIDGDSTVPNDKGKRPVDQEGFAGHWVLRLNGNFAPEIGTQSGGTWRVLTDETQVKRGDYIQVSAEVEFNKNTTKPGVYINHRGICFTRSGEAIKGGEFDARSAGFSDSQPTTGIPMGAPAGFAAPAAAVAGYVAPAAQASPPTAVAYTPHPAFVAGAAAPPPPPPPAPAVHQMTAKAGGATYEQFVTGGWTDANMRLEGFMV